MTGRNILLALAVIIVCVVFGFGLALFGSWLPQVFHTEANAFKNAAAIGNILGGIVGGFVLHRLTHR